MPVGKVRGINYFQEIKDIDQVTLAEYYLDIPKIPCLINSPLRQDKKPSFSIFCKDNGIFFKDFATGESGNIYSLLSLIWSIDKDDVFERIYNDLISNKNSKSIHLQKKRIMVSKNSNTTINVRTRDWEQYDIDYWESFGITLKWLKFAEVYPVSLIIIEKNNNQQIYKADKYSYAYVEHKEDKTTIKVYQPFNTDGFKWRSGHDSSVLSLWTKIPKTGNIVCICSSLKDALCLWANTGIPSIAVQGEAYNISNTATNELKKRFRHVCVCYDNDKPGLIDAKKICEKTGFINIILPNENKAKDISDYYKSLKDKVLFKQNLLHLFKDGIRTNI